MCYANNLQRYSSNEERGDRDGYEQSEETLRGSEKGPELNTFKKFAQIPIHTISITAKQKDSRRRFENLPQTQKGKSMLKIGFPDKEVSRSQRSEIQIMTLIISLKSRSMLQ